MYTWDDVYIMKHCEVTDDSEKGGMRVFDHSSTEPHPPPVPEDPFPPTNQSLPDVREKRAACAQPCRLGRQWPKQLEEALGDLAVSERRRLRVTEAGSLKFPDLTSL